MEASGRSSSAALAEIDDLLADIIPHHQPRRGFDQTGQTGYLSVDALRGRLAVAMPSPDRLAIAPNSRQMEILTKRVAPPPVIPAISPRTSSRLADLNKTALLVHKDRQEAKLKEGARERKLKEARREAMGKTPDYLKHAARRRDKAATTGSSLPQPNRHLSQPQSHTQVPRNRRSEQEGLQRAPHLVQKPETNQPTPLFRSPSNQNGATNQHGVLLTPVSNGKDISSQGLYNSSNSRGQPSEGLPNASKTLRGADTPIRAEAPEAPADSSATPASGDYAESLFPGPGNSSNGGSRLTMVATAPPTLLRGESWMRCAARGGSGNSKKEKHFYYYNASTGESRWEPPEGFSDDAAPGPAVSTNERLSNAKPPALQPVRPSASSSGRQSPRVQATTMRAQQRRPTSATTAGNSSGATAGNVAARNMPPHRPVSAVERRRVPRQDSSTTSHEGAHVGSSSSAADSSHTLAPLHATPVRASSETEAAAPLPNGTPSEAWNSNNSNSKGFGSTWMNASNDDASDAPAAETTAVQQVKPKRHSIDADGAATESDSNQVQVQGPNPPPTKLNGATSKRSSLSHWESSSAATATTTSNALITRSEIVGDEARKETSALSEWVANPFHASLLKQPGHLLIVITHFEHPDQPGSGRATKTTAATTAATASGVASGNDEDVADGAPSASTIVAAGTAAAAIPAPAFSRYQKSASEVGTALEAVVQDLAGVQNVTVRTQPGLPGELNVCCAIRHSPRVHKPAQVYTKVLFSRQLSGGWPSVKRTSRKLTDWLRDEVGVSMVPKAAGRAQSFEKLICESVVRSLDEWKLTATWVKILDVPFEDAVRFEYDGPTPPPKSISEVAKMQLDAAKAKAQAQIDLEKASAAAAAAAGGVVDKSAKGQRAKNKHYGDDPDGDQLEVVSDDGSSSDDSDNQCNEAPDDVDGQKATAADTTSDHQAADTKKRGSNGSTRRNSSGGGLAKPAESSSGRSSWRRLQSAQARLAASSGDNGNKDAANSQPATAVGGRALKTKDAAALTVFKWRAAKARSEGMEGVPTPKAPPPPRPLATSTEALSALMNSVKTPPPTRGGSARGGGGMSSSISRGDDDDISTPEAAAAAAAAVAATEELPTRTVHVCRVPGRARLVLFGVRDAPHAYAPTQGYPGTVLEAAAAAPPSVAFAATAPSFTGSSRKVRRDLSNSTRSRSNSYSDINTNNKNKDAQATTTVYRGMHWHCLLPAGRGFGHDVGFAESPDLNVNPGRGDASSWPNLSTSSPSSKPLLLTDKKGSGAGTPKNSTRSTSSSALVVSNAARGSDEKSNTAPTAADGSNSSNVRGDVRLERMSWAGSGGGRCPGTKLSKLAVPTHPWPPGTQVRLLDQIEHMPAGSNAVIQRVVLRPEGSANSAKAPPPSPSQAPRSFFGSSAADDQLDSQNNDAVAAGATGATSSADAAANGSGAPSSPRTISLHNPFAYKVKAPGLATGTVMGADCPARIEPTAPWHDPSVPIGRRKVLYVLMFGSPILPPAEVEEAMLAEAAKVMQDEEEAKGEDGGDEEDLDGIQGEETMLALTAAPEIVSTPPGIMNDDAIPSGNEALLDRPPGMTDAPADQPPGMDSQPTEDDVTQAVVDVVASLIESAAARADAEIQAIADAAALEAKRLAVEEAAQAHVAAAAGVNAILDRWEDWVDIQERARAEIAAAAEARAQEQQRRAAQAAVAAAEQAAAEAERRANEAAAQKEMLARELAAAQAREEALKKALTIRSEETQLQTQLDEARARERTLLFGIRQSEALAEAAAQRRHQSACTLQAVQRGRATRQEVTPQLAVYRAQLVARLQAAVKIQVLARQRQAKREKQQRLSRREQERAEAIRAAEQARAAAIARAEEVAAAAAAAQDAAATTLQCTARRRRAQRIVRARRASVAAAAAVAYAQAARMQRALRFMQSMGSTVEHMWLASAWGSWEWSTAMLREQEENRAAITLQAQNRRRSAQREAQARAAQAAAKAAALAAQQQAAALSIQCATRQRQAQKAVATQRVQVNAASSLQRATRGQQARATVAQMRSFKRATCVLQGACRMLTAKRRIERVRAEKLAMGLARWDRRAAEISARIASTMSAGDDAAMTEALERDSFKVGARVEARRKNQSEWVGATVSKVNGEEDAPATSFDITMANGESEQSVPRMRVRLPGQREPYTLSNGTLCEARVRNNAQEDSEELVHGVVMSSWPDGQHYMVEYGNSQRDPKVPRDQIFVQCAYKKSDKAAKKKKNRRHEGASSFAPESSHSPNRGHISLGDDATNENPEMAGLAAHRRNLAKLLSELEGSLESLHWHQGAACKLQAAERGRQGRSKTRAERQARLEAERRACQEAAAAVTLQTSVRQRSSVVAADSARSARVKAKQEQKRHRAVVVLQCMARLKSAQHIVQAKRHRQNLVNQAQRAAAVQLQCLVRTFQAKRRVTLRRLESEATLAEHRRHLSEALTTLGQRLDGLHSRVGAAMVIQCNWRRWLAVQQCKRIRNRRAEALAAAEATSKAHVLARERSMRREAEQERYLQRKADEARRLAENAAAAEVAALEAKRAAAATQLQSQARRLKALETVAIKRGEAWLLAEKDSKMKKNRRMMVGRLREYTNSLNKEVCNGAPIVEDEVSRAAQMVSSGCQLSVGTVVEVRKRHRLQPDAFPLLAKALDPSASTNRDLATGAESSGSMHIDPFLAAVEATEAATLAVFGESGIMTPTANLAPLAVWESGVVVGVRPNNLLDVKCVPSGEVRYLVQRHWLRGYGHRELFDLPVGAIVECGGQMGQVVERASREAAVADDASHSIAGAATDGGLSGNKGKAQLQFNRQLALVDVQLSGSNGSQLIQLPRRWLVSQCEAVPRNHTAAAITIQAWARQLAAFTVVAVARNRAAVRSFFDGRLRVRNLSELSFLVGAIVEARYKGREQWFPAAIANVGPTSEGDVSPPCSFDMVYADGDFEEHVPRLHVRLANQIEPFHLFHGDICQARFDGSRKFYPGVVVNAWPDGQHYMVEFDDGDRASKVPRAHVIVECAFPLPRHARAATTIQSFVRGTFGRRRAFYLKRAHHFFSAPNPDELIRQWLEEAEMSRDRPQTVRSWNSAASSTGGSSSSARHNRRIEAARVNLDVSFGIEGSSLALGDNEDYENSVEEEEAVEDVDDDGTDAGAFLDPPTVASVLRCLHGVSVEARYKSRELWFPAVVESVRENGTLNLFFDDGDCAFGTPRFRVRLSGQVESWRLAPGFFVDARFRSSAKHFPGIVVNAWPDGQHYMVEFDDGDRDPKVPRAHILSQGVFPAPTEVSAVTRIAALCRGVMARRAASAIKLELEKTRQLREEAQRKEEQETEARAGAATALQSLARGRSTRKEIAREHASARIAARVARFFGNNSGEDASKEAIDFTNDDDLSFLVGSNVEARYRGRYEWFKAIISAATTSVVGADELPSSAAVTMDLVYADGDTEHGVPRFRVRMPGQIEPCKLEAGALVDGRYDSKSLKLYPGVVVNAWPDGQNYMVEFDDGDKLPKVPREHLLAQCVTTRSQPISKLSEIDNSKEQSQEMLQDLMDATGSMMHDNAVSPHNSPLHSVPDDVDEEHKDDSYQDIDVHDHLHESKTAAAYPGDAWLHKRSLQNSGSSVSNASFSLDHVGHQSSNHEQPRSVAARIEAQSQIEHTNMAHNEALEAQQAATTLQAAARGRFAKQRSASLREQRVQLGLSAAEAQTLCDKLSSKLRDLRSGRGLSHIHAVFESACADSSGDALDFFELEHAVELLIGQRLPSAVVAKMVKTLTLASTPAAFLPVVSGTASSLTLLQFVHLVHTFDFEEAVMSAVTAPFASSGPNNNTFEVEFHEESLGFKFRSVPGQRFAVSAVLNQSLEGVLAINDVIVAVNGAPTGAVEDPGALVKKIVPLRRPLKIMFYRTSASAVEGRPILPTNLRAARIEEVFAQFDVDKSGNLDIFDLAHAVEALIGQLPSTNQVAALVKASGASANKNTLTLAQFTYLMRTYDWTGNLTFLAADSVQLSNTGMSPRQYEYTFRSNDLGCQVMNGPKPGQVVVASVASPESADVLSSGDVVVAVNGAPTGYISDPETFLQRLKHLWRPLVITFERPEFASTSATSALDEAANSAFSLPRLKSVFRTFDVSHRGSLDAFEVAHAIEALLGYSPTSNQVSAFLGSVASARHASITLPQFCYMMRAFDWADDHGGIGHLRTNVADTSAEEEKEKSYELSFPKKSLGFKVQEHESENGVIVVSTITDVALVGLVAPGDALVTVNGVPLGSEIADPRQLQAKLGPARRPVRIGFLRGGNLIAGTSSTIIPPAGQKLSRARIQEVFAQFDVDKSGNLAIFDLAHAVEVLIGQFPSTNQVAASLSRVSHDSNGNEPSISNMLSLAAFSRIVQDLKSIASDSADDENDSNDGALGSVDLGHSRWATPWLAQGLFELHFPKEKLGFNVQIEDNLSVAVVEVADPSLQGILSVNDRIIAMNGAPIGAVSDPDAFIKKVILIRRPVKFTFERSNVGSSGIIPDSNVANGGLFTEDFSDLSVGRLTSVHQRFTAHSGGLLDPFELLHALQAVHGTASSSQQIAVLMKDLHNDDEDADGVGSNASSTSLPMGKTSSVHSDARDAPTKGGYSAALPLSLVEFVHLALISSSSEKSVIEKTNSEAHVGIGEGVYELDFDNESLGFRVRSVSAEGALVVSRILDPSLANEVGVRDVLVAVNGVPLGFVTNPKAVQERVARIRPVRLAFQRYATPQRVEAATFLQAWQRKKLAQAQVQQHRSRLTGVLQLQRTARYFLARSRAEFLRAARDQLLSSRYWEGPDIYEIPTVDAHAFVVGTEVEARYRGRHQWFRAMIVAAHHKHASFDLRYEDGDSEQSVPRMCVRLPGQREPYKLSNGTLCDASYEGSKKLYSGNVVNAWRDGEHYMVEFHDGDRDAHVPRGSIFTQCFSASSPQLEALQRARNYPLHVLPFHDKPQDVEGSPLDPRSSFYSENNEHREDLETHRMNLDARSSPRTPRATTLRTPLTPPSLAVTASPKLSLSPPEDVLLSPPGCVVANKPLIVQDQEDQQSSKAGLENSIGAANDTSSDEESEVLSDSCSFQANNNTGDLGMGSRYY